MDVMRLQQDMKARGLYLGLIDGIWGEKSEGAYQSLLEAADKSLDYDPKEEPGLAWGSKVNEVFRDKVGDICLDLEIADPDWLMACMAFESAETFNPQIRNAAGSGAVGLIQFMPATARHLGTTSDALSKMSAVEQLDYVHDYFRPYRGRLSSLGDIYLAILWPRAIGKPDSYVLWSKGRRPTAYRQNSGLDANNDHAVTRSEAVAKVKAELLRGRRLYCG